MLIWKLTFFSCPHNYYNDTKYIWTLSYSVRMTNFEIFVSIICLVLGSVLQVLRYVAPYSHESVEYNRFNTKSSTYLKPSMLHMTAASSWSKSSSQMVPQVLLYQTSTLPSLGWIPPANRTWTFAEIRKKDMVNYVSRRCIYK